ncbi:hypothetical protein NC981_22235 [Leptolyngbya sp. DQ-M1]|uniref:hypothetical protein n=1 Tax=Leptolyngbya sp. DQ-M1 TaxID=2933920 RepID=UPI003299C3B8
MKDKLSGLVSTVISLGDCFPVQFRDTCLGSLRLILPLTGGSLLMLGLAPLFTPPAQAESPYRFYRVDGRPEVYLVDDHYWDIDIEPNPKPSRKPQTVCHVQNPSQMETFGGFGQVQVVRDRAFMRGRVYQGECSWLNGFYRLASRAEIYRLNNTHLCWVSSPEMMETYGGFGQVIVVEDSSDLLAGRKNSGTCEWPK